MKNSTFIILILGLLVSKFAIGQSDRMMNKCDTVISHTGQKDSLVNCKQVYAPCQMGMIPKSVRFKIRDKFGEVTYVSIIGNSTTIKSSMLSWEDSLNCSHQSIICGYDVIYEKVNPINGKFEKVVAPTNLKSHYDRYISWQSINTYVPMLNHPKTGNPGNGDIIRQYNKADYIWDQIFKYEYVEIP